MKCFGLTDKGRVRKDNQDSFIIEKCEAKNCLIVGLCDGMGGAKAGGLASQLSNKAFVDFVYGKLTSRVERVQNYKDMLQSACDEANGVSYEYSKFDEAYNGMGTTIVGGVIKNSGKAHIINVGDSRAYHISRKQQHIPDNPRPLSGRRAGGVWRDNEGAGKDSSPAQRHNPRPRLRGEGRV